MSVVGCMDVDAAFLKLAAMTRGGKVTWVRENDAYQTPYKGFSIYVWPGHGKLGVLNRQKLEIGPIVIPVSGAVFKTLLREVEESAKPVPEVLAMVDNLIDCLLAE